jgi:hypothetical protein
MSRRRVTTNYNKTPLRQCDVMAAIPVKGWISLTVLCAKLEPKIPPDCAIRRVLATTNNNVMLEKLESGLIGAHDLMERGRRGIVQMKLCNEVLWERLEKKYTGTGEMMVRRPIKRKEARSNVKTTDGSQDHKHRRRHPAARRT